MKSSLIPAVRVEPQLRESLESVLAPGESLSQFVEASVRERVERRRLQAEFVARGQAAIQRAKQGAPTVSAEAVLKRLGEMLSEARNEAGGLAGRAGGDER